MSTMNRSCHHALRRAAAAVAVILSASHCGGEIHVVAYDVDPPIVVDGLLDDWENVPNAIELRTGEHVTYMPQTWDGPADLSGTIRLAWRGGIYLAAEVTDDVFQQPHRGQKVFSGDHVNLWLDMEPTREPDRTTFGEGQYHVAFSPGDLAKGAPTPPEVVVYLPTGARTIGTRVAARRTENGYVMEAFVPFGDLRVPDVRQDRFATFEVALGDSDNAGVSQETFMTSGTTQWQYLRSRMLPMVFGSGTGTATLPEQSMSVCEPLAILKGKSVTVTFNVDRLPPGYEPYLFLRGRHDSERVAGYASGVLAIGVNGERLLPDRLTNRSANATMEDNREQLIMRRDGRITLPHAPDLISTDADKTGYALRGGVRAVEYEFHLGGLVREGENTVTFEHIEVHPTYRQICLNDLTFRLRPFTPGSRPKRAAPTGELPVFEPQVEFPVTYTELVRQAGLIRVSVGGERYTVQSRFSTPDGQWREGSSEWFGHTRQVVEHDEWIEVRDTFENRGKENLPLMQRHRLVFDSPAEQVWLSGTSKPFKTGRYEHFENPSVFAATETGGVGLLPLNDEFRVHAEQSAHEGEWAQLADPSFVLKPGTRYTAEWAIVPVTTPDYWRFVNATRRMLGVNFTLQHVFAFVFGHEPIYKWDDVGLKQFLDNKSVSFIVQSNDVHKYRGLSAHGTPFFTVPHDGYVDFGKRIHKLYPDGSVKTGIYCHWFLDIGVDSPSRFHDCRGLDAAGRHIAYSGPDDVRKVYVPTLDNAYGKAISRFVDVILDEIGADGVYNDEFTHSRSRYVYNMWDGCSADIGADHTITRLKGAVPLISRDFRFKQISRILDRRAPLVINGQPATRTLSQLKFQAFVETGSGPRNAARTHLYSPVLLGDHLTEHTYREIYSNMVTALNHGCLYAYYYQRHMPNRTLTEHMYPFTPIELHAGYVIGRERILTVRSGLFGWGDGSGFDVHVYDRESRETDGSEVKRVERGACTYAEVRIPEGYSVALVRQAR